LSPENSARVKSTVLPENTGNDLTAHAGATLRELMDRMGHSSTQAALIYMHGGDQRQRIIAEAVSDMVRTALENPPDGQAGPR
jgi:hypothetical protein